MLRYIIIALVVTFLGCSSPNEAGRTSNLPTNAVNITDKGNGWYTFELDGKKFLCNIGWAGYSGWAGITEVSE